jgi:hypothetical protein
VRPRDRRAGSVLPAVIWHDWQVGVLRRDITAGRACSW